MPDPGAGNGMGNLLLLLEDVPALPGWETRGPEPIVAL